MEGAFVENAVRLCPETLFRVLDVQMLVVDVDLVPVTEFLGWLLGAEIE